jgi:predicted DNA-binding transcriptional regulator AlpA
MDAPNHDNRPLDPNEAAQYLKISRRRLDRYREEGDGPRFRKFGAKVAYTVADLDAWSIEHAFQSTQDPDYPPTAARRREGK